MSPNSGMIAIIAKITMGLIHTLFPSLNVLKWGCAELKKECIGLSYVHRADIHGLSCLKAFAKRRITIGVPYPDQAM